MAQTIFLKFSSTRFHEKTSHTVVCEIGKGKAIHVTGRGGPQGCETSRLPDFLYNRFTDGGEVVKPYTLAALYPRKIPGTDFC
jgi:hypothetical protein